MLTELRKVSKMDYKSQEEGKDQESIQADATPDPGYHMEK